MSFSLIFPMALANFFQPMDFQSIVFESNYFNIPANKSVSEIFFTGFCQKAYPVRNTGFYFFKFQPDFPSIYGCFHE
jgi:hypothetical protein